MENGLLILLSLVSIAALYWVIWGQRKYNDLFRDYFQPPVSNHPNEQSSQTSKEQEHSLPTPITRQELVSLQDDAQKQQALAKLSGNARVIAQEPKHDGEQNHEEKGH